MIKQFLIFKARERKSEKSPTHNIVQIEGEGDTKKYVYLGSCWSKKGKSGVGYLSCQMNNPYNDKKGYHITEDKMAEPKTETPPEENFEEFME